MAKPPETGAVAGRVVNAVTGEPLKKATVLLWQQGKPQSFTTATTAGGWFAMQDVEPGKYRLTVSRGGYARTEYGAHGHSRQGTTLSLDPGQRIADIVLRLTPQAIITGRVLDPDGDPMRSVEIYALQQRYVRGKRQLQLFESATTNDLGEYRLFGLAPGRYYLRADYQDWEMMDMKVSMADSRGNEEGYAPTYYPGTSDAAGGTTIDLQPGALIRGIDLTLVKTRTVRLRGSLIYPGTDKPVRNASIELMRRSDIWMGYGGGRANTDEQGNFEIRGVAPGAYLLQAYWSDGGKNSGLLISIDVAESNIENINLQAAPGAELKGRVRVEGHSDADLRDLRVSLQSPWYFMGSQGATVKSDGSFMVSNLNLDKYTLTFYSLPENYYAKAARWSDKDVLETGLDLTGGVTGALDVVLSSDGGQLEGVVLNAAEQPATTATVALVPDEPRRAQTRLYKGITTDQYGRFTIKGIAPGGYKLFAWEDVEEGAYQDPDFLKPFEALGTPFTIREGSRESAELRLIPAQAQKAQAGK